nr:hypothetical protein [Tanacetum cinerariifolium]
METFATVSKDTLNWIIATAKAVQIIFTIIDNDIYSAVDACPNAMDMWKAIERLKHVYHPQSNPTHYTQNSSTRSHATTRNCGKEIANSYPPPYGTKPEVDTDDETSSKDKEIDQLMALITTTFKKIYKPTNNNLRTLLNPRNLHVDNIPRNNRGTGYDRQEGQYENQRAVNVARAKENVRTQVVQQTGIQCFNYKEFGHVTRDCHKTKRPRDSQYHNDKMMICNQELEANYMYMAQIQEVFLDAAFNFGPIFDSEPLLKVQDYDDNYNEFTNDVFSSESEHHEQPISSNGEEAD